MNSMDDITRNLLMGSFSFLNSYMTWESLLSCHKAFGQSINLIHPDFAAGRLLLGLPILSNAITVQHFWSILTSLRDKLGELPPHEVPNGDSYARILLRMVDRLMLFPIENIDAEDCALYLCRRNYDGCLGRLLAEMAEGFVIMQQCGMEEEVYVRNKELHAEYLHYLASHLSRA